MSRLCSVTAFAAIASACICCGFIGGCAAARPGVFPSRAAGMFNVRDYGAKGDGAANDTEAIRAAVSACRDAGGGCVLIPAGVYRAGMIDLHSDMELRIGDGATLVSTLDPGDFRTEPGDAAGTGDACLVAQIRARHASNVKITGRGTVEGRVMSFMFEDFENGGVGEEHFSMERWQMFRPRSVYFEDVKNWTIRDVAFHDSAGWTVHLRGCVDGIVDGVRICNPLRAANTDGIDVDSCRRLVVRNCSIETGDDAVVLKTKSFADWRAGEAKYGACEDIQVSNVTAVASSAAFKIGTETSGDIRGVRFVDCRASGSAQALSVYSRDGGVVEDVVFERIEASAYRRIDAPRHRLGFGWWGAGYPIFVSAGYRTPGYTLQGLVEPGRVSGIVVRDCRLECEAPAYLVGLPGKIENVRMEGVRLDFVRRGRSPTDRLDEHPSMSPYRAIPMPAVFADHVAGLVCKGVEASWRSDRMEGWTGEFAELTRCADARLSDIRLGRIADGVRRSGVAELLAGVRAYDGGVDPESVGTRILEQVLSTPPERYSPRGWRPPPEREWGVGRGVLLEAPVSRLLAECLRFARAFGLEYWQDRVKWQIESFSLAKREFVPDEDGEDRDAFNELVRECAAQHRAEPPPASHDARERFVRLLATMDEFGNVGEGSPESQAEMLRLCTMLKN